jgi:molybdate transport system substrate-binding protein
MNTFFMITRSHVFRQQLQSMALFLALLVAIPAGFAEDLQVSAAVSLKQSLEALTPVFQAAHPGARLYLNFGASGTLARQIEAGAPVDVFFSASSDPMNRLERQKLLAPASRKVLLGNEIVLVVNPKSVTIKSFTDLPHGGRLGMGDPAFVPVGQYARQTLKSLQLWSALKPQLVFGADAHQVLTYALRHEVDAALVFATDMRGIDPEQLKVVATAPANSHQPIRYEAAVVAASGHSLLAREYLNFLGSAQASAEFASHGFTRPDGVGKP